MYRARHWRLLALLSIAALPFGAAACGSDDEPSASATGGSTAKAASAFPVTIEHARGSTTIESEPKRIVTIGFTDHETLLALGIKPVGAMDWFGERPYGKWQWEAPAWGGDKPEIVNPGQELNLEKIAALAPDVIIGAYADLDAATYEKLSQIAPTVAQAKGHRPYTTPWQDMARTIGKAVGRLDDVNARVERIEARFAEIRKQHPEFADQTAVVVDAGTAPKSYWAFNSADPRGQLLTAFGFRADPALEKETQAEFGASISPEKVSLLDVGRLFLLADPEVSRTLDRQRVFTELDVVKENRDVRLRYYTEPAVGAAMAFSTILSIPFATDGIMKELEREP
jgi:iron-siderophore transport system substrate-binding protein